MEVAMTAMTVAMKNDSKPCRHPNRSKKMSLQKKVLKQNKREIKQHAICTVYNNLITSQKQSQTFQGSSFYSILLELWAALRAIQSYNMYDCGAR